MNRTSVHILLYVSELTVCVRRAEYTRYYTHDNERIGVRGDDGRKGGREKVINRLLCIRTITKYNCRIVRQSDFQGTVNGFLIVFEMSLTYREIG